jgi:2,3-bisphosphoglycerate-independent phosphoglycerate mutase
MKYVILLGDGMADYPIADLDGKTPLECAKTPHMDRLSRNGTVGLIDTIPEGKTPGSDVANLAVLGYDPQKYHTGRGPLEAASMGVVLNPGDMAFRCNLVTLNKDMSVIEDFNAEHITSEEAHDIIDYINKHLGSPLFTFYPGVGYRHLLVWKNATCDLTTTPPHDTVGEKIAGNLPRGNGAEEIIGLMKKSQELLRDHPVNIARIARGKRPANSIWLWGEGRAPAMEPLTKRFNITGGMISAVDLLKGIGVYAGLDIIHVEGATGYIDTDYAGKAQCALKFLREHDFVFVHVEAPDEMGHEGNIAGKIKSIEDFDEKVVGTIVSGIQELGDFRIAVLSDHPTPIALRTHTADPSPFVVFSSKENENIKNANCFGEKEAKDTGLIVSPGHEFIDHFIKDWRTFVE